MFLHCRCKHVHRQATQRLTGHRARSGCPGDDVSGRVYVWLGVKIGITESCLSETKVRSVGEKQFYFSVFPGEKRDGKGVTQLYGKHSRRMKGKYGLARSQGPF